MTMNLFLGSWSFFPQERLEFVWRVKTVVKTTG